MPKPLLVTVIDDDEYIRDALGAMFAGCGYRVECFDCAETFLARETETPSSVIVSDLQMSGMSGLDLVRRLRTIGVETPFILITAFATDAIRRLAERAGVACLLEKPFDPPTLISEVEAVAA